VANEALASGEFHAGALADMLGIAPRTPLAPAAGGTAPRYATEQAKMAQ
jgi:hypothetical protein